MRNSILIAPLFLLIVGKISSQVSETLTSGSIPAGWSQTSVTFETTAGGYANFTATSSVLTSPILDVATGATITFDVAKFGSGTDGPLTVQVSNDGGATWTAQSFNSPTPTSSTYLTSGPTSISVTGSNIRVRWIRSSSPSQKRLRNIVISNATVLPISLTKFNGIDINSTTLLTFSTATELNNSHFAIERSADARNFTEIGRVQGAGTTQEPHSYTFTDEKPLAGTNYYRLRQVDFDGTESFSSVVSVVFGKTGNITIMPSPATDRVHIQLEEALTNDGRWQVFDNTGRQVLSGNWDAESADFDLDVNVLPEGMYTFRLAVGTQVQVKQFRKM